MTGVLPLVLLIGAVVSGTAALPERPGRSPLEIERRTKFMPAPAATGAELARPPAESALGVVALVPVRAGTRLITPRAGRAMLDQIDKTFVPNLLPIVVGTTVEFPNHDAIYHNVFSYSAAKRFDLGRYAGDESREVTFDKVGVVRIFCEIHSFMNATIVVLPTAHYSVVGADGVFEIHNVPAGDYEVLVWHGGLSDLEAVRSLSVAATDSVRIRLAP